MLKSYVISLVVGMLAGVIYGLIDVNSPAPPVIALLGLFGMLVGEQLVPLAQRLIRRQPVTLAWFRHECVPKISGTPPSGGEKGP
ncbi:XapX domain-containing protein [Pantoea cypripedii]|uniref:ABC transporter substrate-binding protein n=1 Tax=Pantoea cypripedii TaxID=55209 RepID=A0A1X1EUC1_PANCY|nr:XapX domain-containing protein [Pantoea cypripedii]MBP2197753.1 XapX domain-containing protein [Pantoea cypripedii]ORM93630.1 ABC transporter substrate-binding protein [Pantoea cypripedii]